MVVIQRKDRGHDHGLFCDHNNSIGDAKDRISNLVFTILLNYGKYSVQMRYTYCLFQCRYVIQREDLNCSSTETEN
jgi:hypothetical protein